MQNKIIIKTGKVFNLIDKSEIEYVKSERNYSRVFCAARNFIVSKTLAELENTLSEDGFIRVNRSTLVNIEKVRRMKELDCNKFVVELDNDKTFQWGRGYKTKLTRLIKI